MYVPKMGVTTSVWLILPFNKQLCFVVFLFGSNWQFKKFEQLLHFTCHVQTKDFDMTIYLTMLAGNLTELGLFEVTFWWDFFPGLLQTLG